MVAGPVRMERGAVWSAGGLLTTDTRREPGPHIGNDFDGGPAPGPAPPASPPRPFMEGVWGPRARWAGVQCVHSFIWTIAWCTCRRWSSKCSTSRKYSISSAVCSSTPNAPNVRRVRAAGSASSVINSLQRACRICSRCSPSL